MDSHWKRTYWVVWTANLVTSIGMMSFLPFFPSLLEEMGVQGESAISSWAGICFAAAPFSATISAPIWGALGDRFGRKLMVCRAMLAIALFVGGMGFVQTPGQLLVMRLGQGMFSGFIPPSITLVSIAAPADRQGRVAGNLATALAVGGLVGPTMGGVVAAALDSRRSVFFVVGALAFLGALLVWFGAVEDSSTRQAQSSTGPGQRGHWGGAVAALKKSLQDVAEVFKNPALRGTALVVFALQFGLGAINPVIELFVREIITAEGLVGSVWERLTSVVASEGTTLEERVETLATSLLFGAMAVANLITLSPWGFYGDRVGHRRALVHCGILSILALTVQAVTAVYAVLLVGRFLMGIGMAGIGPLAFGLAAGEASADRRGGAFGVVFSARTFAVAVGGTAGGILYPYLGARGVMAASAVLLAVTLLGFQAASARAAARADHE